MEFKKKKSIRLLLLLSFLLLICGNIYAASMQMPSLKIGLEGTDNPKDVVNILKVMMILTVLSLAPSILITMTSFTRIIIVLSFVRQAIGTQNLPPNQLLVGMALFLTFFVMSPVFNQINERAITPYVDNKISQENALKEIEIPLRKFMFSQTRAKDLELFLSLSKAPKPANRQEVAFSVLVPSFMISELKTSFQIGFMIYLPFLIIDMVVSSVLMAMGMMMLPPVMIALPFKLMLFVLVDGWGLIINSLVKSFG